MELTPEETILIEAIRTAKVEPRVFVSRFTKSLIFAAKDLESFEYFEVKKMEEQVKILIPFFMKLNEMNVKL